MKNASPARGPSTIVNRTVTPRRPRNADLREREYLTPKEVDRLQDAARKHSRYGHRDATAILIAYRHGLRASELCELTWNMIELDSGRIHVRRAKNGVDSTHPLTGKEIRALRQLRRENLQSRYVFTGIQSAPTVGDVAPRRPHQRDEALQRLRQGETQADIARSYAVDPATISSALRPAHQGPSLRLHGGDAAPAQQRGRHDEYPLARRYRASMDGWS